MPIVVTQRILSTPRGAQDAGQRFNDGGAGKAYAGDPSSNHSKANHEKEVLPNSEICPERRGETVEQCVF